jgi:hypothetical protein
MIPRSFGRWVAAALLFAVGTAALPAQEIPAPASHFGFETGTDGKLADWNELILHS